MPNSRDMVMKKAMVSTLRELTFLLETQEKYIHSKIVTSAVKKLLSDKTKCNSHKECLCLSTLS